MSRRVFKTSEDTDGNLLLWFSSRGRLVKVAKYNLIVRAAANDAEMEALIMRDAKIFLKGFRKGLVE